jgi:hypothetical protein
MTAAAKEAKAVTIVPAAGALALTPMDMISRALESGAGMDTIDKLMGLQERWEKNQARKAFDAAIAAAKAEIRPVVRNRQGNNSKRYADFAAIASAVDPILSEHGLSYRFRTEQADRINVTCVLSHRDGHSETTTLCGPADASGSKNAIQAIGSTLTYLQRYSLVQMLGLAASNDDDGKLAAGSLSDEQADKIRDLLTETKADVDRFLKWAGAASVADIPAAKFEEAVAMLNAKKAGK